MITEAIQKLVDHANLVEREARAAMEEIMTGQATDAQIAAFLTALRMKGETVDELVGFATVMREKAEPFWDGDVLEVVDTCGTGGDRSGTFNISTAAAFVAAGAGVRVAKHGNRSISSRCGSADVLEALGVDIDMPVGQLRRAVREVGIAFLFAPHFHSSMRYVMPTRSQLKIRTVFNILGPLANPARAPFQTVGVSSLELVDLMAQALARLGVRRAFVVYGTDGLDEVSIAAPTHVREVSENEVRTFAVTPEDFGLNPSPRESIQGGDAATNARIIEDVLKGQTGPCRDVVMMNATLAIAAAGAKSFKEASDMARRSIESGAAWKKLEAIREFNR